MCGWMPNGILAAGPSRVTSGERQLRTSERRAAHEDVSSGFLFALETAQGAKLDAGQWVNGRDPIFKSIDVQAAMDEINLLPAQRA